LLFSFLFLQTFFELLFQGYLFCFLHFLKSLDVVHLFLELSEILVNRPDLLLPWLGRDVAVDTLINVLDVQLHLQLINFLPSTLGQLIVHNLSHYLCHLILSDLPDSIFQNLAV
jgi:hypothetical protein